MRRTARRAVTSTVAALAAAALTVATLASPAAAAPAGSAGKWLKGELTDGLMHNPNFGGFNDYGLTLDAGFAFSELGRGRLVRKVRRAVAPHVDSYVTGTDFGAPEARYAGAVAKALAFAQASGADPRSYGGFDLVSELEAVTTRAGRIKDRGGDDYANTIGQTFAARALWEAGSRERRRALAFLVQQQCSAGYFRLNFSDPAAADQSCDGGDGGKAGDTDVTALAVLALETLPHGNAKAQRSIRKATRWLSRRQADNGSFTGGPTTATANANSTGLAAWALGEAGRCAPAARAARWVSRFQVAGDVSGTPFAGERGAIAYDRSAYRAGRRHGITDAERDQWRRTTTQAAPGLRYLDGC